MPDLTRRVAIVTGSSLGIGKGCALELARCGADVTVNYRTHRDEAETVAQAVRDLGRRALVVQCDVSNRQQVQAMVDQTVQDLGGVDIMIPNAVQTIRKPFLELEVEEVEIDWATSLWGVFHCCQLGARQMVQQGRGGKICVVSSIHSTLAFKRNVSYNTAKAGINQMAITIANELVEHRINVNVLEPGWTDTPGERKHFTEQQIQEGGPQLPMGRIGTIEDMGKAAAFLCSDDADYITGTVLRVDGGFSFPDWRLSRR